MPNKLRPPAVPLVTVDPYFSVWSMSNRLNDDYTRHWTGARSPMTGIALVDGRPFLFAGRLENSECVCGLSEMEQTDLTLTPLSSRYSFACGGIGLKVSFTTPLLPDELDILSRPVSYISFSAEALDGMKHSVRLYLDITPEWSVHNPNQPIVCGRRELAGGMKYLYAGSGEQNILGRAGDDVRIDWGHVVLAGGCKAMTAIGGRGLRSEFIKTGKPYNDGAAGKPLSYARADRILLACAVDFGKVADAPVSDFVVLAYDDIYSIDYFGKWLPAYWRRDGSTFDKMLAASVGEYEEIMERCREFDGRLLDEGRAAGGEKYAELLSLAYRQAVAAHKLVQDEDGRVLFISKENFSNACMGTVDVSYPSTPLFLLYNTELVKGMLRPIFKFARMPEWKFDFAPHDVGCYPRAHGQVYGMEKGELELKYQMPVEECGNMLIMASAVCHMENCADFAEKNRELLDKWAAYLKDYGLDPGNQLCTDDFAGHLAHNANLSIKAIVALGAYSRMCSMLGREDAAKEYADTAGKMAEAWRALAEEGDHYRLTFDRPGTWSLKYNLIWDDLLGLNLFPKEVKEKELSYYMKVQNRYGVPLDCRNTYTKADWLVWAAAMADSVEAFSGMLEGLWNAMNETPGRVPFTDWYDTVSGRQIGFQNRSVVGGIFIRLLKDRMSGKRR